MKDYLKDLFTWKWRWNRSKFWIYPLLYLIPILLLTIADISYEWYNEEAKEAYISSEEFNLANYIYEQELIWKTEEEINKLPEVIEIKNNIENKKNETELDTTVLTPFSLIILILTILYLWISTVAYIKRLHDLNKSGLYVLITFMPFISIILLIYCGFFRWTPWKNRFWENPLGNKNEKTKIDNWVSNEL